MAAEASPPQGEAPRRVPSSATVYVGVVAAVGLCLTAAAVRLVGIPFNATFWVVLMLAMLAWWVGSVDLDGRMSLSFTGIVMLAAMALIGPAGAGIVGMIMGPFENLRAPLRARVFNAGMVATMGVVGGSAFLAAGGVLAGADVQGTWEIVKLIGVPLLIADVLQFVVNILLVMIVVRLTAGVPLRAQGGQVLSSAAPAQLGYGVIAFIMVVLWGPGHLGSASVFLILPPLLVAHWAYRQYAEEIKGHERALGVLVAAIEAKAPHLVGHSSRVAELCGSMAEQLGLRSQAIVDVRTAGMLHDLGLTTLPTSLVRSTAVVGGGGLRGYPARGVRLLRGLSFLSGSLDAIAHHRDAVTSRPSTRDDLGVAALVVGLADEYDLLTAVGTPDGVLIDKEEALSVLRDTPAGREDIVRALEQGLTHRTEVTS